VTTARTIPDVDFQAVTPDAKDKSRFVLVDAVGVTARGIEYLFDNLPQLRLVSRSYTEAGAADASYFETLGALAVNGNFMAYNVAMVGLGLGSLFFCYLLFRSNLVPRFLAVWGFVGYAIFESGCVLEILGFAGTGLVATIPGGLFEIFFGIWLIAKGSTRRQSPSEQRRQLVS
jgi:hypothetical protein